jgi:hypothetical protein
MLGADHNYIPLPVVQHETEMEQTANTMNIEMGDINPISINEEFRISIDIC